MYSDYISFNAPFKLDRDKGFSLQQRYQIISKEILMKNILHAQEKEGNDGGQNLIAFKPKLHQITVTTKTKQTLEMPYVKGITRK